MYEVYPISLRLCWLKLWLKKIAKTKINGSSTKSISTSATYVYHSRLHEVRPWERKFRFFMQTVSTYRCIGPMFWMLLILLIRNGTGATLIIFGNYFMHKGTSLRDKWLITLHRCLLIWNFISLIVICCMYMVDKI